MLRRIDSGRQGAQPSDDGCLPVFVGFLFAGALLVSVLGYEVAHMMRWI